MSTLRTTTLQHGSSAVQNIVLDNQGRALFGPDGPQGRAALYVNAQNNRIGINNETPTVALDVDGAINVTSNTTLGGTLSVTGITTLTNDLVVDTNTLFVDVSTNRVGIGTNSPTQPLQLNAATGNMLQAFSLADSVKAYIGLSAATNSPLIGAVANDLCFRSENANIKFGTASSTRTDVTINSSGNVGLGTSSPSSQLHCTGDIKFGNAITLSRSISTGLVTIADATAEPYTQGFAFRTNETAEAYRFQNGGGTSTYLTILGSGAVGIGTTSPTALLQVGGYAGNNGIQIGAGTGSTSYIHFGDAASGAGEFAGYVQYTHSTNALQFGTDSNERMRIDSNGALLVGTLSFTGEASTVLEGSSAGGTTQAQLWLNRGSTPATDNVLGQIIFGDNNEAGRNGAMIQARADLSWNTSDYPSRLAFFTTADGASSPTERMRIDSRGRHRRKYPRYTTDTVTGLFGFHAFAYLSERAPGSAGTARYYRLKSTTTMVYSSGSVPPTIRLNVAYNTYHASGAGSGEYIIGSRNGSGDTTIQADLFRKLSEHSIGGWFYALTTGFSVELYLSTGNGELIIKVIGRTGNGGTYDGNAYIHIACEALGGTFSNDGTLEIIPLGNSAPSELGSQVTPQTVSWS